MGKLNAAVGVALAILILTVSPGHAVPVYWADTGHYYDIVFHAESIDWLAAKTEAESLSYAGLNGHLATMGSQPENDFIRTSLMPLVPEKFYWLGGYQPAGSPEPGGNWQWVTGEAWSYTNWWSPQEPNNALGDENYLEIYGPLVPETGFWNDLAWHWKDDAYTVRAYVVEYEVPATPVPEPSTLLLLTSGLAGLGGVAWKRRKG